MNLPLPTRPYRIMLLESPKRPKFRAVLAVNSGGTRDHNILEIEIYNENKSTSFFRADNSLGHLRLGGLAELITKHEHCITEPAWYPVFHQSSEGETEEEKQGEILVKFYFQNVEPQVFALGYHNHLSCERITNPDSALSGSGDISQANYNHIAGSQSSSILTNVGAAVKIAQTVNGAANLVLKITEL
ncbi:hypothetical protein R1flu_001844 [Riccia fluitans]|uniref:Uncharacterized protein n=1 Tax=Riccia fluitans TaxID=41844 RepID=A0ABD1Y5H8_9MARC